LLARHQDEESAVSVVDAPSQPGCLIARPLATRQAGALMDTKPLTGAAPAAPAGRSSRVLKVLIGVAISGVFLYATLRAVPFRKVVAALGHARPEWILLSLVAIGAAYFLKTCRWAVMLRSLGAPIKVRDAAVPLMGAVAFNNVLPFRAGDVIRIVAFQRYTRVPASAQLGTLVLERLLDLFVLMSFLFAAVSFWRISVLDEALLSGLRLVALGVAAAIILFIAAPRPIQLVVRWVDARFPQLARLGEALLRLSGAISTLSRPLLLARLVGISIVAWAAEGGAYFAVGHALGVATAPQAALLALCVGTLSTVIPSSPGYVGTFHYFTSRVVTEFGGGAVGAAAYAILIHALLWLSTTAAGFLLMALAGFKSRPAAPAIGDVLTDSDYAK
jgi:uncharacterized protein (TIRG00374 family)